MKMKGQQSDNLINQSLQAQDDQVVILSTSPLFQWLWKGPLCGIIQFLIVQRSRQIDCELLGFVIGVC